MQDHSTEMEIAWAAGLFEGEGCWNAYRRKSGKIQMQVRLAMTDRDVVERFASVLGFGQIHRTQKHDDKPVFTWCIYEAEKIRSLVALFLPYMGERRRAKALEVLDLGIDVRAHCGTRTHCPQGHPYEGDNLVRENGRRRRRTCHNARAVKRYYRLKEEARGSY